MLVLAHRGASRDAPENTLDAFRLADRQGADGVELDVRLHRVGPSCSCATTRSRRWTSPTRHRPPTLDDALDACATGCSSTSRSRTSRPTADSTRRCRSRPRTIEALRRSWRAMVRSVADLVVLVGHDPGLPPHRAGDPDGVAAHRRSTRRRSTEVVAAGHAAIHPWERALDASVVERCHAAGLRVNTWTCNDPDRLVELTAFGVDGVCTNVPDASPSAASLDDRAAGRQRGSSQRGSGGRRVGNTSCTASGTWANSSRRVSPRSSPSTWYGNGVVVSRSTSRRTPSRTSRCAPASHHRRAARRRAS